MNFINKYWQLLTFAIGALITLGTTLKAVDVLEARMDRVEAAALRIPYIEGKVDVLLERTK